MLDIAEHGETTCMDWYLWICAVRNDCSLRVSNLQISRKPESFYFLPPTARRKPKRAVKHLKKWVSNALILHLSHLEWSFMAFHQSCGVSLLCTSYVVSYELCIAALIRLLFTLTEQHNVLPWADEVTKCFHSIPRSSLMAIGHLHLLLAIGDDVMIIND